MIHTIISWDCSFRNFFHLIDGLLVQNFPKNDFELIYVEQRNKEHANNFNHLIKLKSLEDRYNEVKYKINIKTIYLNHSEEKPYHLGLCNNEGIKLTKGEIISIMDGDQLLPSDFLTKLTNFHKKNNKAVVNLYRKSSYYPVAVNSFEDWMNAKMDFKKCLNACPSKYVSVPKQINNYGPMVSAKKEFWEAIEGYDTNPIWSTVLSKSGLDVNTRLEIVTGETSTYLPKTFSVHPWHPIGGGSLRKEKDSRRFFNLQDKLINWSKKNRTAKVSDRKNYSDQLFHRNREFIEKMLKINMGSTEEIEKYNIKKEIVKCNFKKLKNILKLLWI